MTERERFREALLFGKPDKVPLNPGGPRESTLAAWHQQGSQAMGGNGGYLMGLLGIDWKPSEPASGVTFR